MLPLNDTEKNRYSFFPIVTVLLILTNCFIFYIERYIVDSYWDFYMKFGTTPVLMRQIDIEYHHHVPARGFVSFIG